MIHCADRANAQRIRMPDGVRAELFVTPPPVRESDANHTGTEGSNTRTAAGASLPHKNIVARNWVQYLNPCNEIATGGGCAAHFDVE
jgi:hypothetical protein